LSAVDRASGNVIWQIDVRNCVKFWPDSVDSVKVFSTATGDLFAADIVTGEVLWRYPKKCYLNSAVMGGIVYAVREDGILVGINQKTGNEVGTIEFSPVGKSDSAIPTYWVATDGKQLFAYFGDSQELIAFQPAQK
jgi:outer membrane protein assembly factor BamB